MSASQVVTVSVEFADDKRADEIEESVVSIEDEVLKDYPGVAALLIKPKTGERYRQNRQRWLGKGGA